MKRGREFFHSRTQARADIYSLFRFPPSATSATSSKEKWYQTSTFYRLYSLPNPYRSLQSHSTTVLKTFFIQSGKIFHLQSLLFHFPESTRPLDLTLFVYSLVKTAAAKPRVASTTCATAGRSGTCFASGRRGRRNNWKSTPKSWVFSVAADDLKILKSRSF